MRHNYVRLEHALPESNAWVCVNWCMGNTCSYACSYCPEGLHDKSQAWPDLETAERFCNKVLDHFTAKGKKLYFEFTGGEVTLWRHLPALCRVLRERGARVGVISNGSRTLRWWKDFAPLVEHVSLSYHPEFADPERFEELARFLSDKVLLHINIMMQPERFEQCFEVGKQLSTVQSATLALQPLAWDLGSELYDYTPAQRKILQQQQRLLGKRQSFPKGREHHRGVMAEVRPSGLRVIRGSYDYIARGENGWLGWQCAAGVEQLVVDLDGTVYRGWCKVGGALGRVTDPGLELELEPVVCDKAQCHCNFDILCTKQREPLSSVAARVHLGVVSLQTAAFNLLLRR